MCNTNKVTAKCMPNIFILNILHSSKLCMVFMSSCGINFMMPLLLLANRSRRLVTMNEIHKPIFLVFFDFQFVTQLHLETFNTLLSDWHLELLWNASNLHKAQGFSIQTTSLMLANSRYSTIEYKRYAK